MLQCVNVFEKRAALLMHGAAVQRLGPVCVEREHRVCAPMQLLERRRLPRHSVSTAEEKALGGTSTTVASCSHVLSDLTSVLRPRQGAPPWTACGCGPKAALRRALCRCAASNPDAGCAPGLHCIWHAEMSLLIYIYHAEACRQASNVHLLGMHLDKLSFDSHRQLC